MAKIYNYLGIFLSTTLLFIGVSSRAQYNSIEDFCISYEEKVFYELINTIRKDSAKSGIELSRALSYVATTHAKDLYFNKAYNEKCSMHSWSDAGRWKAFCHSKGDPDIKNIKAKPKEISYYRYPAYEFVYYDNTINKPENAIQNLLDYSLFTNFILGNNNYKKNWQAIGVGYYQGYLCIWMGEKTDSGVVPQVCDDSQVKQLVEKERELFLIIIKSFSNIEEANQMVKKLHKEGYSKAKIISSQGIFSVSIMEFSNLQEAENEKNKIKDLYQNIRIFKEQ